MPRNDRPTDPARRAALLPGAALTLALVTAPAAADNRVGAWSALEKWPLIPLHALLLPDGRVLSYGSNSNGSQTGGFIYDLWSPMRGLSYPASHWTLPNRAGTDLFCSAQIVLPQSGNVALLGGDIWNGSATTNVGTNNSNLFNPTTDSLTRGANMHSARWYATATTLPNGETYIQGGRAGPGVIGGELRPEIRDASGNFRVLGGADTSNLYWYYPRNWVAPDGRIFGYTNRTMYYVNPAGDGSLSYAGLTSMSGPTGVTGSEVMFAPGRILRVGGGALSATVVTPGLSAAAVIDINGGAPVVTPVGKLPVGLHWPNATVIPDGRVVVTGGGPGNNLLAGANYNALIWNPANPGVWTVGARTGTTTDHARLYHSIAMLLPDASILVGGGGASGTTFTGPAVNANAERYYPPYLFTAAGQFAPRPRILQAPDILTIGTDFSVRVASQQGVSRVTLIKTGSVTHSFDMEQRFLEMAFRNNGGELLVSAPRSLNRAPPGRYMMFVLDAQGVPSIARIVAVAAAGTPPTLPAFDGLEYIASYPDLIRAFGADRAAGERHYQVFGKAEGRVPNSFNARQYLANYTDLQRAFGTDLARATRHFITYGLREGRTDKAPPTGH